MSPRSPTPERRARSLPTARRRTSASSWPGSRQMRANTGAAESPPKRDRPRGLVDHHQARDATASRRARSRRSWTRSGCARYPRPPAFCAVPVFPATRMNSTRAACAVPSSTTRRQNSRRVARFLRDTTRRTITGSDATTSPVRGSATASHQARHHHDAVVGDGGVGVENLERRHRHFLPERHRGAACARTSDRSAAPARRTHRASPTPVRAAEAEQRA